MLKSWVFWAAVCHDCHSLSAVSPIVNCGKATSPALAPAPTVLSTERVYNMRSGGSIITFICYVVFNILKISSNNIYKNKNLYNVVVLIAQLPRVLQPVEGFNTRQTRQNPDPYPLEPLPLAGGTGFGG